MESIVQTGSRLAWLLLSLGFTSQIPWISSQVLCTHRLDEAFVLLYEIKKAMLQFRS